MQHEQKRTKASTRPARGGARIMRLIRYQGGRFQPVSIATGAAFAPDIETCIRKNMNADGSINSLCLDFCGSYVPLIHENEVCLAARLLATYHNSLAPAGPAVHSGQGSTPIAPWTPGISPYCEPDTDEYYPSSPIFRRKGGTPAVAAKSDDDCYHSADSGQCGESDSEDEKETRRRLAWDFEQNEDIEAAPCFGKTGLVLW